MVFGCIARADQRFRSKVGRPRRRRLVPFRSRNVLINSSDGMLSSHSRRTRLGMKVSLPQSGRCSDILVRMARPLGVTVIGCFFLLAGIYLCSIAATTLVEPRAVETLRSAPFVLGLRQVSPYVTLLIGAIWALVAWGLFRLRDWARFSATLMLAIGIAWALSMTLLGTAHFGWKMLAIFLEIVLRAAAVLYLLTPSVMVSFRTKSRSSAEIR